MSEGKIAQANGRLKLAAVGVRIEAKGDRLYFEPHCRSNRAAARSRTINSITLHYRANPYGGSLAEKEVQKSVH